MPISRRAALSGAAALSAVPLIRARAAVRPKIHLGVLTDLGGTYRDNTGPNSVACAHQAVRDFNPLKHGFDVEMISADHQNKPNVASTIARQWFDQGLAAVIDVPTSDVALAVATVAREKDRIMLNASAATSALTDAQCSPNTIQWSFDTYMEARSQGGAVVKKGIKKWFFITADYAFGHILESQAAAVVKAAGGTVVGNIRYPFPTTTDFSAYLTQAQASGAQALGLANAGLDTDNCIKQAHEFGVNKKMTIAPMLMFITDVHSVGLPMAQGLNVTTTFYWNYNARTRAFTKRVLPHLVNGAYPNMAHASSYAVTYHYLKTVAAMGPANALRSGAATVARMKGIPTDDDAFGKGRIRMDGRGEFPAYLWRVKKPSESKMPWDVFDLQTITPASGVLHPLNPKCHFPVKA